MTRVSTPTAIGPIHLRHSNGWAFGAWHAAMGAGTTIWRTSQPGTGWARPTRPRSTHHEWKGGLLRCSGRLLNSNKSRLRQKSPHTRAIGNRWLQTAPNELLESADAIYHATNRRPTRRTMRDRRKASVLRRRGRPARTLERRAPAGLRRRPPSPRHRSLRTATARRRGSGRFARRRQLAPGEAARPTAATAARRRPIRSNRATRCRPLRPVYTGTATCGKPSMTQTGTPLARTRAGSVRVPNSLFRSRRLRSGLLRYWCPRQQRIPARDAARDALLVSRLRRPHACNRCRNPAG